MALKVKAIQESLLPCPQGLFFVPELSDYPTIANVLADRAGVYINVRVDGAHLGQFRSQKTEDEEDQHLYSFSKVFEDSSNTFFRQRYSLCPIVRRPFFRNVSIERVNDPYRPKDEQFRDGRYIPESSANITVILCDWMFEQEPAMVRDSPIFYDHGGGYLPYHGWSPSQLRPIWHPLEPESRLEEWYILERTTKGIGSWSGGVLEKLRHEMRS